MQLPEFLEGESLTRLLQGAAVGAIGIMIVGFKFFDWTLASTAAKAAEDKSREAVVAVLAPICAAKFQQASDVSVNLVAFNKESSWNRGSYIQKGGWATFPGQTGSNYDLADSCAKLVGEAKP